MRQEKYPPLPALSVSLLSRTASLYFYSNRISPRFQPLQTKKPISASFLYPFGSRAVSMSVFTEDPEEKRQPYDLREVLSSAIPLPYDLREVLSAVIRLPAPAFISGLIALQVFEKLHRYPSRRAVRSHAYCLIFSSPSTKKVIFSTQCMQYIKTPSKRLLFPEKGFIIPSPGRLDIYSTFTIAFKKVFR